MTTPPAPAPRTDVVDPGWAQALAPVRLRIGSLGRALAARPEGYLPAPEHVLRAFSRPLREVRVLVVGQDPYPTPGHAVGLAFSVAPGVRPLPRSLANVLTELTSDVGAERPLDGDLTPWADQGVLLLNRVLTVAPGKAGGHRGLGWEQVTDLGVQALVDRGGPLVAVLWGRDAQSLRPLLGDVPVIASPHPSPLSARRGFFGSRPFSGVNALLAQQGAAPIDWTLARGGTMSP
ncbi:MAG: uracil-DNA glycosylase [Rhodoferax sp.]|nr:uracil-DNA glycosylase [Actinomycetota bacterium]